MPHLGGAVEALVAPGAGDSPEHPRIAREVGIAHEHGDVLALLRVIAVEARLADGKELEAGDVVARLVAGQLLTVAEAVLGEPQAEPVAGIGAVVHRPEAARGIEHEARPAAGVRLVVGAEVPCGVHLRLQQQPVVIYVTQAVAAVEGLQSEERGDIIEGIDGRLVEHGLVAVLLAIGHVEHQVGLVAADDEIAVGEGVAQLLGRSDVGVAVLGSKNVVVALSGLLKGDAEAILTALIRGGAGEGLLHVVHDEVGALGAVVPLDAVGQNHVGNTERAHHTAAGEGFCLATLLLAAVHADGLQRGHHFDVEASVAHGAALIGKLADVVARGGDIGNRRYGSPVAVVPKIIVGPSRRSLGVEDEIGAREHLHLCAAIDDAAHGDFLRHGVGRRVAAHGDGKGLTALRAVGSGVGDTIDKAAVGPHGDGARGLTGVPLPQARVGHAVGQLRNESDVGAVGGDGLGSAWLIFVFQASEIGLVFIEDTLIDDVARERRDGIGLVDGRAPGDERGEAQMVVAAGVGIVVAAASVGAKHGSSSVGILHRDAAQALIVAAHAIPHGATLAQAGRARAGHLPAGAADTATVGIFVEMPREILSGHAAEVHGGHKLGTGGNAVVHISKKVIALIEADLADVEGAAERHHGVALIASRLLHLAEIAEGTSLVGQDVGHKIADELVATVVVNHGLGGAVGHEGALMVVLIEADALVVHMHVVAQNTDGHHTEGVTEAPVAPVVTGTFADVGIAEVGPCVVTAAQEVDGGVIPHLHHPLLEFFEIFPGPSVVVAHQLGGVGELVAVEACGQRDVGVAGDGLRHVTPVHQRLHGPVGIGSVAADLPTQRVLESAMCASRGIHIVVAREAALHILGGPSGGAGMRPLVVAEDLPGAHHIFVLVLENHLPGSGDVFLRHQSTGMHEALTAALVVDAALGGDTLGGLGANERSAEFRRQLVNHRLRRHLSVERHLHHIERILQLGHAVDADARLGRSDELAAIVHQGRELRHVALGAVAVFALELQRLLREFVYLPVAHGGVIQTEVGHIAVFQIGVAAEGRTADPTLRRSPGEHLPGQGHRRGVALPVSVDEELALVALLAVEHVHPSALGGLCAHLDARLGAESGRRDGGALGVQPVGQIESRRLRHIGGLGKNPEKMSVARKRLAGIHAIAHRHRELIRIA